METLGEYHHLRCFTDTIDVGDLVEFLKLETNLLVIVSEISSKNHRYHIHATLRFKKSVNAFRDKFRVKFPSLFGNKSYSISLVRNYDSNIKYCLKGKPNDYPDVLFTTLSVDEVKQYYNEYWSLQDIILKAKKKPEVIIDSSCNNVDEIDEIIVKKPRSLTWSQKLTKHIIAEYPLLCQAVIQYFNNKTIDYDYIHEMLIGIILEHLGETSKNLDEFILLRLFNSQVNAIIQKSGNEPAKRQLKKDLSQKLRGKSIF